MLRFGIYTEQQYRRAGPQRRDHIRPPFVLSVRHREPRRYLLNLWLGARARRRFTRLGLPEGWQQSESGPGYRVRRISCVHPRAAALAARDPRFQVRTRSVFEVRRRHATCCER
jgi:hypothetical protein